MATAAPEDGFVQTSKQAYPYHTLHAPTCANAKRAIYGHKETVQSLAPYFAQATMNPDFHRCLEGTEAKQAVIKAGWDLRQQRLDEERRHRKIRALAVAKTAAARLEADLGTLTDAETVEFRETCESITNKTWTPSQHDTAGYLYIEVKRDKPEWY